MRKLFFILIAIAIILLAAIMFVGFLLFKQKDRDKTTAAREARWPKKEEEEVSDLNGNEHGN